MYEYEYSPHALRGNDNGGTGGSTQQGADGSSVSCDAEDKDGNQEDEKKDPGRVRSHGERLEREACSRKVRAEQAKLWGRAKRRKVVRRGCNFSGD